MLAAEFEILSFPIVFIHLLCPSPLFARLIPIMSLLLFTVFASSYLRLCAIQILIFCMASEHLVVLYLFGGLYGGFPFSLSTSFTSSTSIQAEQGVPVHISIYFRPVSTFQRLFLFVSVLQYFGLLRFVCD